MAIDWLDCSIAILIGLGRWGLGGLMELGRQL